MVLVSSSRQMDWNGILVEQYQSFSTLGEAEFPAQSDHWFNLCMGSAAHLIHKHDHRLHESIIHKGDNVFVPAGQPTYWRCQSDNIYRQSLHIYLKPELVGQVAEASEIDSAWIGIINSFGQKDLQFYQVAMLLLAELQSDGIMGRLYVESLTQVLIIR
jgi:AraC family transcriptional regulator